MKILFVSEYFYPRIAGGEKWSLELCQGLSQQGHDITVITSQLPHTKENETYQGIKIIRIAPTGNIFQRFRFASILSSFLKQHLLTNTYDVIHSMAFIATLPASKAAKASSIPSVTSVHSYFGKYWFKATNPLNAFLNIILEKVIITMDKSKSIHVPSQHMKDLIQPWTKKRIVVIPNYLDARELLAINTSTNKEQIRKYLGIKKEKMALSICTLYKIKNVFPLVKKISLQKDIKFFIIGEGDEKAKIDAYLKTQNITNICMLGTKTRKEMLQILASSDIFINSSYAESFSYVMMEAFLLEKSIITTATGISSEIKKLNPSQVTIIKDLDHLPQLSTLPTPKQKKIHLQGKKDYIDAFTKLYKT